MCWRFSHTVIVVFVFCIFHVMSFLLSCIVLLVVHMYIILSGMLLVVIYIHYFPEHATFAN